MDKTIIFNNYPDVLDFKQFCTLLGISSVTGYRIIKEKQINCLKIGRAYKIPKISVMTFLNLPITQ